MTTAPVVENLSLASRGPTRPLILSDRQGFDRRWFAPNLKAVYVPTHPEQVLAIVNEALSTHGRNVKITSGRHCYENFVYNDETAAVIDMSALNQVGFDNARQAYFVDAGCENWTVYRTLLNTFGKTLPAGSCYSVGAGGHITGGGYGLLSRLHGLTVDHLSAVDIVTWDAAAGRGKLSHVSASSADPDEKDLFWALRGAGGGNFGVIARYYFQQLPDAPDHATLWTLAWDWSSLDLTAFTNLLAEYADLVTTLPDSNFTLLKLNHVAASQVGMVLQVTSPAGTKHDQHRRHAEDSVARVQKRFAKVARSRPLVRPLGGHPGMMTHLLASDEAQHITYLEALQTLNGSGPNQFGKYKSAYMKKAFPAEQVTVIYEWLHRYPTGIPQAEMAQSLLQVDSYGGAINRYPADSTPVPQRSSLMKLQYQTYWNNASKPGEGLMSPFREQAEAHVGWINGFYKDVYAAYGGTPNPTRDSTGTVDGCYYNYPDEVLGTHAQGNVDQALWLYFLQNFRQAPRNLVKVKRRWDPTNYFHHAQSIPVS
ncbi:FAD-binding protein [Myxococcus sp. AB025B]|uniref:FAD-dependent oxidoreductase n=1 Tax=Myxococcus sp. AB025B TaxID=2562794 RepID=UPI001141F0DC|nr:FAD-binding protein [Myxococcus sp. AB025B]